MAISAEYMNLSQSDLVTEPLQYALLQRLIDEGAVYIPQALTANQFATLNALLYRVVSYPESSPVRAADGSAASLAPRFRAYPLGLDELDRLARTHAGYSFVELPPELQDAMLDLIASEDLTTEKINLALWLEDLRSTTAPRPHIPPTIDRLY